MGAGPWHSLLKTQFLKGPACLAAAIWNQYGFGVCRNLWLLKGTVFTGSGTHTSIGWIL
jgi:hypothetical protein